MKKPGPFTFFLLGFITFGFAYSAVQDFLGQVRYVNWCIHHWNTFPYWISLMGVFVTLFYAFSLRKRF